MKLLYTTWQDYRPWYDDMGTRTEMDFSKSSKSISWIQSPGESIKDVTTLSRALKEVEMLLKDDKESMPIQGEFSRLCSSTAQTLRIPAPSQLIKPKMSTYPLTKAGSSKEIKGCCCRNLRQKKLQNNKRLSFSETNWSGKRCVNTTPTKQPIRSGAWYTAPDSKNRPLIQVEIADQCPGWYRSSPFLYGKRSLSST